MHLGYESIAPVSTRPGYLAETGCSHGLGRHPLECESLFDSHDSLDTLRVIPEPRSGARSGEGMPRTADGSGSSGDRSAFVGNT